MLQLYGNSRSRALRCLWMLEEMGKPYQLIEKTTRADDLQSVEYLRLNPNARIPTLVDGRQLRKLAPPFGPPDFMGSARSVHDDPLIRGTECLGETGQGGFDEPGFEDQSCGLAVRIEFFGHPQRL